jgi:hypothetical protein
MTGIAVIKMVIIQSFTESAVGAEVGWSNIVFGFKPMLRYSGHTT